MPISIDRLRSDLERLAGFGATPDGGVTRLTFSPEDRAARDWLAGRCADAGLGFREDAIGNVFMRLDGPPVPPVWTGSHLDSVPNGGRFDGALGVMTALECVRTLAEERALDKVSLARPVEAVSFADEEGHFIGYLGSRGLVQGYTPAELEGITGRDGVAVLDALREFGIDPAEATRTAVDPQQVHAFVELHIEQGSVLETEGTSVGVVTHIVGIGRGQIIFRGRADHAGTTPMGMRRDAMRGAADLLAGVPALPAAIGSEHAVITCGRLRVSPGGDNVVPGEVVAAFDFRSPHRAEIDAIEQQLRALARRCAQRHDLDVEYVPESITDPLPLDKGLQDVIAESADSLGLRWRAMPSGAGHDSQVIGTAIPTGMIFVPSREGRSHSPLEHTDWDDIERGANVLLDVLRRLAVG
jgi:beta-ureidopropionase / N-carbamoyl-L-amino-acid hydrolase